MKTVYKQVLMVEFDEDEIIDMCKRVGFPDVKIDYDETYDGEQSKVLVYLEKKYTNETHEMDAEQIQSLSDAIGALDGVYDVEDAFYDIDDFDDESEFKVVLTITLDGLIYNENDY